MAISKHSSPQKSLKLIYGLQDGPAKTSALQMHRGPDSVGNGAVSSSSFQNLLENLRLNGLSWKMCQAYSAQTKGPRLRQLSTSWKRSGIWGFGSRATFATRASLKIEKEYSLSEVISPIVSTNSILTAANCLGIIRRERRAGRGGKLDPIFRKSLFQTLRFWFSVAEASGLPKREATAPRYVPKLDAIKAATQIDQYYVARNLTWDECEKLMGFPEGWTVAEGDSLATR